MKTRLLDLTTELDRLVGTELEEAVSYFPDDTRVIVIEDGGSVVGCWGLPRYLHCEGLYIHPAYRQDGVVGRRLIAAMQREAAASRDRIILTAALTPDIVSYCKRVGGQKLPGEHYVLPIEGRA